MSRNNFNISVYITNQGRKQKHNLLVHTLAKRLSLDEILASIKKQDWVKEFIEAEGKLIKQRPGYILLVDNQMIPDWEINNYYVSDDQIIHFVPYVAGG
jgi:hypothetical protein